jgi:membrane protein
MNFGPRWSILEVSAIKRRFSTTLADAAAMLWQSARTSVSNFIANNDLLWASALAYTVALSIIPVLALAFSVLTGLGGAQRLRELINQYLALGSTDITDYIMHFVSNINSATLGSVGAIALLLTVLSTLGTIELAFNTIWQVPSGRSYLRKFADYLSVVFTVPLILVAALTLTARFATNLNRVPGLELVLPFAILWIGFFFLFVFFPYTSVRWNAALFGSFVSALLFQLAQWAYIHFQVGVAGYRAIYGALATVPILLVWIYVGWAIVLFGVELTFAVQRGQTRVPQMDQSPAFARYATLLTLLRLAERFDNPGLTVDLESLAAELQAPVALVAAIVARLERAGLVVESSRDEHGKQMPVGLFLSHDPAQIRLGDALRATSLNDAPGGDARVVAVMKLLADAETDRLHSATLGDLRQGFVEPSRGLQTTLALHNAPK